MEIHAESVHREQHLHGHRIRDQHVDRQRLSVCERQTRHRQHHGLAAALALLHPGP